MCMQEFCARTAVATPQKTILCLASRTGWQTTSAPKPASKQVLPVAKPSTLRPVAYFGLTIHSTVLPPCGVLSQTVGFSQLSVQRNGYARSHGHGGACPRRGVFLFLLPMAKLCASGYCQTRTCTVVLWNLNVCGQQRDVVMYVQHVGR